MIKKIKSFIKQQVKNRGVSLSVFPNNYRYYRGSVDKQKYAQEGYNINCIFNSCVKKIFNQALTIPIRIVNKNLEEIEHRELQKIIDNPNDMQGFQSFLSLMIIDYLVFGDIYIRKNILQESLTPQLIKPMSLSLLRPFRIEIEEDKEGYPANYIYRTEKGERKDYPCDLKGNSQLIHIKTANPLKNTDGVSALEACAISVDQHNMAGAWNVSLLKNGAKLDTVIKTNRILNKEQRQEAKESFKRYNSGFGNAGEPIIMDVEAEIESLGLTPNDMDWLSGYETAMKNICISLGVPVDLIYGQSTYENLKTANEQLAENTTIPMMKLFVSELNKKLVPLFSEDIMLNLDLDKMPAMMSKKDRQREALEKVSFMTINEKREMMGLDPVDGGEKLLVNANQIPLNDLTEPLPTDDDE